MTSVLSYVVPAYNGAIASHRLDDLQENAKPVKSNPLLDGYGDLRDIRNLENKSYISADDLIATFKLKMALIKHVNYVLKNPQVLAPLFNDGLSPVTVNHSGIKRLWSFNDVRLWFDVKVEAIKDVLGIDIDEIEWNGYRDSYMMYIPESLGKYLNPEWLTSGTDNLLERAVWLHRSTRPATFGMIGSVTMHCTANGYKLQVNSARAMLADGTISYNAYYVLKMYKETVLEYRPTLTELRESRAQILQQLASREQRSLPNADSAKRFDNYWLTVKRNKKASVDSEQTLREFNAIPLLGQGTVASRTWGIEVETVRAGNVHTPSGWDRTSDGSLDVERDCNCRCDNCYEYDEHCGYSSDGCHQDDDEAAEFVSPILKYFNSRGLRSICEEIPVEVETNETPGIHVHVNAADLTVIDVARLLQAYSIVSPFLEPVYQRVSRGYCKDTTTDTLRFWLSQMRDVRKTQTMPELERIARNTPDDRYHDVNVNAINKHGTIEFRAMGGVYNYEYLIRWAWLVREMVNVSRLDLPVNTWVKCKSLKDVIDVLIQYGSETSATSIADEANELLAYVE